MEVVSGQIPNAEESVQQMRGSTENCWAWNLNFGSFPVCCVPAELCLSFFILLHSLQFLLIQLRANESRIITLVILKMWDWTEIMQIRVNCFLPCFFGGFSVWLLLFPELCSTEGAIRELEHTEQPTQHRSPPRLQDRPFPCTTRCAANWFAEFLDAVLVTFIFSTFCKAQSLPENARCDIILGSSKLQSCRVFSTWSRQLLMRAPFLHSLHFCNLQPCATQRLKREAGLRAKRSFPAFKETTH